MTEPVFVHDNALCEAAEVGAGTRIWAFAHVMDGARVGQNCNIGEHVFVESGALIGDGVTLKNHVAVWDGVTIEDEVFVGPAAVFTNDPNPRAAVKKGREDLLPTLVRHGATIGANATIVCGLSIGAYAFVGAGAVVVNDVPDHALVVGNPARRRGWACACGLTLGAELACTCGRRYVLVDEATGLVPRT